MHARKEQSCTGGTKMIKFKDLNGWLKALVILGVVGLAISLYNTWMVDYLNEMVSLLSEWSVVMNDWTKI